MPLFIWVLGPSEFVYCGTAGTRLGEDYATVSAAPEILEILEVPRLVFH